GAVAGPIAGGAARATWALRFGRAMTHHYWRALLCPSHECAATHTYRFFLAIWQGQQSLALRAGNRQRAIPRHEVAGGIIRAAIEDFTGLLAASLNQIAAALRAERACLRDKRALVCTFGIARTRDEFAKATGAQHEWFAAFRAGFVQLLNGLLHLAHLFFGALQLCAELGVEVLQEARPALLALLHGVELALHI